MEEERKDVKTMKKALEILASTFEQLCFLLQVEVPIRLEDPNDTHERMTDGKEIESDDDNNSVDLENIDWFFEEECKTLQTQYVNSHKVTSSPSSPSSSSSQDDDESRPYIIQTLLAVLKSSGTCIPLHEHTHTHTHTRTQ